MVKEVGVKDMADHHTRQEVLDKSILRIFEVFASVMP